MLCSTIRTQVYVCTCTYVYVYTNMQDVQTVLIDTYVYLHVQFSPGYLHWRGAALLAATKTNDAATANTTATTIGVANCAIACAVASGNINDASGSCRRHCFDVTHPHTITTLVSYDSQCTQTMYRMPTI